MKQIVKCLLYLVQILVSNCMINIEHMEQLNQSAQNLYNVLRSSEALRIAVFNAYVQVPEYGKKESPIDIEQRLIENDKTKSYQESTTTDQHEAIQLNQINTSQSQTQNQQFENEKLLSENFVNRWEGSEEFSTMQMIKSYEYLFNYEDDQFLYEKELSFEILHNLRKNLSKYIFENQQLQQNENLEDDEGEKVWVELADYLDYTPFLHFGFTTFKQRTIDSFNFKENLKQKLQDLLEDMEPYHIRNPNFQQQKNSLYIYTEEKLEVAPIKKQDQSHESYRQQYLENLQNLHEQIEIVQQNQSLNWVQKNFLSDLDKILKSIKKDQENKIDAQKALSYHKQYDFQVLLQSIEKFSKDFQDEQVREFFESGKKISQIFQQIKEQEGTLLKQCMLRLIKNYNDSIKENPDNIYHAISELILSLERIHPYIDFNNRLFAVLMLNKELLRNNQQISVLSDVNSADYLTIERFVNQIKIGQNNFRNLLQIGKIHQQDQNRFELFFSDNSVSYLFCIEEDQYHYMDFYKLQCFYEQVLLIQNDILLQKDEFLQYYREEASKKYDQCVEATISKYLEGQNSYQTYYSYYFMQNGQSIFPQFLDKIYKNENYKTCKDNFINKDITEDMKNKQVFYDILKKKQKDLQEQIYTDYLNEFLIFDTDFESKIADKIGDNYQLFSEKYQTGVSENQENFILFNFNTQYNPSDFSDKILI